MKYPRTRVLQAFYIMIVIILGLASRSYGKLLPTWLATYSGDVLWAVMVYLIVGFFFTKLRIINTALIAFGLSALIEISQLYHAPWIDAIRSYTLGGLLLGYGFLWSDILCYLVGVAIGAFVESISYSKDIVKGVRK